MTFVETRYEHIVLDDQQTPLIAGTTMKVVELVVEHLAYGWSRRSWPSSFPISRSVKSIRRSRTTGTTRTRWTRTSPVAWPRWMPRGRRPRRARSAPGCGRAASSDARRARCGSARRLRHPRWTPPAPGRCAVGAGGRRRLAPRSRLGGPGDRPPPGAGLARRCRAGRNHASPTSRRGLRGRRVGPTCLDARATARLPRWLSGTTAAGVDPPVHAPCARRPATSRGPARLTGRRLRDIVELTRQTGLLRG